MPRHAGTSSHPIVDRVRRFVDDEVRPVASALEHADEYPHALVARMKTLGLFGSLVPESYGGLGLPVSVYAEVIEELCRGWMSLAGVLNSHTMMALIVLGHGTEEQRRRFLPRFATGESRGGLCLTEPHAGSDVQAIRTVARRRGDDYVIDGTKMFITNGREGNAFALLAVTDGTATPRHRGMSCFIVEKGHPGFRVAKNLKKLGYKGVETTELIFEEFVVPAANLVGGAEGRGFAQVMSGLETGRINIASRCVGVAQAAYETALAEARLRGPRPALADMGTRVTASRLVTRWAAAMKDRGERCDVEAGMAKLYASESAQHVAVSAMRLAGPRGHWTALDLERHYRDTPLMIIGEGTNEIQRTIIARNLLERYGERSGASISRDDEPDDARAMVLAVRQFVEKEIVPAVPDEEAVDRHPAAMIESLADLGILGALAPVAHGGLALDLRTCAMIVEEIARGWTTIAAIVASHLAATHAIATCGTPAQRERWLPPMTRAESIGVPVLGSDVRARRIHDGWVLSGIAPGVETARHAGLFVVTTAVDGGGTAAFVVAPGPHVHLGEPHATMGGRGLGPCDVVFDDVRVEPSATLAAGDACTCVETVSRLGFAATAVGLAQAALEAALRYSRERTAFGKPICQHQAIQLKLADMATWTTVARRLTYHAAAGAAVDPIAAAMARIDAAETAAMVTLESMRIHGGYGYVSEFPVERYYRDAARLLLVPRSTDDERAALATRLVAGVGEENG